MEIMAEEQARKSTLVCLSISALDAKRAKGMINVLMAEKLGQKAYKRLIPFIK